MKEFDTFLSYNSKDKRFVRRLVEELDKRKIKVWFDEWELPPGQSWQIAVEQIIETAKSALVLIGGEGLGQWERPEMRACINQFILREIPVIPVLLPGASSQPKLGVFLEEFSRVDLREGLSKNELNRLVWGITRKKPVADEKDDPLHIDEKNSIKKIFKEKSSSLIRDTIDYAFEIAFLFLKISILFCCLFLLIWLLLKAVNLVFGQTELTEYFKNLSTNIFILISFGLAMIAKHLIGFLKKMDKKNKREEERKL